MIRQRGDIQQKVTIADTLYDAANDIRDYIEDDMVPSDKLNAEIMHIVMMMDALRGKIDALGSTTSSYASANFEKAKLKRKLPSLRQNRKQ
jgi:hypothetical protein